MGKASIPNTSFGFYLLGNKKQGKVSHEENDVVYTWEGENRKEGCVNSRNSQRQEMPPYVDTCR